MSLSQTWVQPRYLAAEEVKNLAESLTYLKVMNVFLRAFYEIYSDKHYLAVANLLN